MEYKFHINCDYETTMTKRFICNKQHNNSGFTMVEMIVTFALLALFSVAVTRVVSYTVMLYHATQASAEGLEVSGILANKLTGIIEGATGSADDAFELESAKSGTITITDKSDIKITISKSSEGYITIDYAGLTSPGEGTTWQYDDDVYMNFIVTGLSFEKGGIDSSVSSPDLPNMTLYPKNVIRMTLSVHNDKYGKEDYSSVYYIKCSNVELD